MGQRLRDTLSECEGASKRLFFASDFNRCSPRPANLADGRKSGPENHRRGKFSSHTDIFGVPSDPLICVYPRLELLLHSRGQVAFSRPVQRIEQQRKSRMSLRTVLWTD